MNSLFRFILLGIPLLISGCYGHYQNKGKCCEEIKGKYPIDEPLVLRNYVIYNTMDYNGIVPRNNMLWTTDFDSLINVFTYSLEKLELPIINYTQMGSNFVEIPHIEKPAFRFSKVDDDWVISVANAKGNEIGTDELPSDSLMLLPVVYLYNTVNFTGFISSGGVAGNNGFFVHTYFDCMVYVLRDSKVIYKKHIRYKSEKSQYFAERYEAEANASAPMIKQEHWDEIVRLAMQDYMKRMR